MVTFGVATMAGEARLFPSRFREWYEARNILISQRHVFESKLGIRSLTVSVPNSDGNNINNKKTKAKRAGLRLHHSP